MGCISYSDLTYKRKTVTYEYPGWAIGVGWTLAFISVIFIPIVMVFRILSTSGSLGEVSNFGPFFWGVTEKQKSRKTN